MGASASVRVHGAADLVALVNQRDDYTKEDLAWFRDQMCKGLNSTAPFDTWFGENSTDGQTVHKGVLLDLVDDVMCDRDVGIRKRAIVRTGQLKEHSGALSAHNIRDDTGECAPDTNASVERHYAVAFDCGSAETKAIKLEYVVCVDVEWRVCVGMHADGVGCSVLFA